MLLVKLIVAILLIAVVISLFSGLFFLVKDKGQTKRTVNALSLRIGLSMLIIVVVMIAAATGVVEFNPDPRYEPVSTEKTDN
jgi:succinate dehydrogenase/fumarate reductase cytochrome b subunit